MPPPHHLSKASTVDQVQPAFRLAANESLGGADFAAGAELPRGLAPRPFLHPITTHAGVTLTAAQPPDHIHHLGLSVAVSDLNGSNFWGGSTYTADGPRILDNHGRQRAGPCRSTPDGVTGEIDWVDADGASIARERRSISYYEHADPQSWVLGVSSLLTAAPGVDALRLSSSAVKGRAGSGYGGIFWRFSQARSVMVETVSGMGLRAAHGSLSPWLLLNLDIEGEQVGIVLVQDSTLEQLPWFIRTDGYLGAGPAVAWETVRTVPEGQELALGLQAVVRDGYVSGPDHVARLIAGIPSTAAPATICSRISTCLITD